MKKQTAILLTLLSFCFLHKASAQEYFNNCSAAFLDNKMVVNEYSPTGKCSLLASTSGTLTVCTANLSPERSIPTGKIKFMVAIRDSNTKTMVMYSNHTYKELDIQKVLSKCKKGDFIVLLTIDNEYALPHNEILVN